MLTLLVLIFRKLIESKVSHQMRVIFEYEMFHFDLGLIDKHESTPVVSSAVASTEQQVEVETPEP